MRAFRNPTMSYVATAHKPLYVAQGDMVDTDGPNPQTATAGGSLWWEDGSWKGTAAPSLRQSTQEELDWVPPHLRIVNNLLGLKP